MFQLEDEEYDLNEEFLEDIFQLTGPQKATDNGNSNRKPSENNGSEFPIPDKKNMIVGGRTYRHSSSSNSSPVSKKAKFPCDSDHRLLPTEQDFLQFRTEGNLSSPPKNSESLSKDTGLDSISNRRPDKNIFGVVSTNSAEPFKFSPRMATSRVEHVNQQDFNFNSHNLRRRKFPGPAGLLPDLDKRKCYPNLSQVPAESVERKSHFLNSESQDEPEAGLSQPCAVGSLFGNNSPWASLRQDMGLGSADSHRNPLSKICLKWARQKASARQLSSHKVPFLAVAIHALDCSSPDPCVILRDPTGEMGGTLHREVWERHSYLLHPGAAMTLRQVGVLSTGAAARRHYLNITENNLLTIYSSAKVENGPYTLGKEDEMSTSEVRITKIRPLDLNEVKRSLLEMQNISQSAASLNILPSPSTLYSSVSSGPRLHSSISNSPRSAPYRAPFSSNLNRSNSHRPSNIASGQIFPSSYRSPSPTPSHQASFVSSPMQSGSWCPAANAVSMDVQCSNSSPPTMHTTGSSPFTPKLPVTIASPVGSFVPKQPFLNKFQAELLGSPSVPYHSNSLGASSPDASPSSQECATAMDVTIGPCVSYCEKLSSMNPSGSVFEGKGDTNIAGAVCGKSQAIDEAELDSILGGIDTDLLFDDDDF